MTTVELIYDHDCPNIERARTNLLHAFSKAKIPAEWVELDRGNSSNPSHVRSYGSPTILIDGKDVAGDEPTEKISCCRLYIGVDGKFDGAPSVEAITTTLRLCKKSSSKVVKSKLSWRTSVAVLPGIGASLLPVGICPACWPAYAGLLGSLGFGFLLKTAYLLPVTAIFLVAAVSALAYNAKNRRGYKPFVVGFTASIIMLIGKFAFENDITMYGGIAMLIAASLWNAWPKKATIGKNTCIACASHADA